MSARNVVIAMSRCSSSKKGYGIRLERREGNNWFATWSFAIQDKVARSEGYEKTQIDGSFMTDEAFPGCPYCEARSFFVCECGKIGCWNGESRMVTCPACNKRTEIVGTISSLRGGTDI